MMKKIQLFLLIILFTQLGFAQDINNKTAQLVAENFFKYTNPTKVDYNKNPLILTSVIKSEQIPLMYLFNTKENNGFVLITSSSKLQPILAYSFDKPFALDNMSPSVKEYLEFYKSEILFSIENEVKTSKTNSELWDKYKSSVLLEKSLIKDIDEVSPLIQTNWGQACFYNASCPSDTAGYCDRTLVGCVATAMGQILKYHNFPNMGTSSHQYNHYIYGNIFADFNETVYDWSNMPNEIYDHNSDIAELLFHCGVSINMYYGPNSSGANTENTLLALINYFNYKESAQYILKDNYSSEDWSVLIKNELNNSRPVHSRGQGSGGHSFVIDGFQDNFFHVNWGWSGFSNGYFYLNELTPGSQDYSFYQGAIVGIQPNLSNTCIEQKLLTGRKGAFNDGSGNLDYLSNSSCQWLIQPSNLFNIKLSFIDFNTVEDEDFVYIYDGETTSDPLIGAFSGLNIPEEIISNTNSLLVEFISESLNSEKGWLATYSTLTCAGDHVYTSSSGTITDGSGVYNYSDELNCSWLIDIESESDIVLEFSEFRTEAGYDSLFIYDGIDETGPLLAVLTGDTLPPLLYATLGTVYINFKTDVAVSDSGWTLNYKIPELINEKVFTEINVYPNPVDEILNIDLGNEVSGKLEIYNCFGQLILNRDLNNPNNIVDLSNIIKGAYFVEIKAGAKRVIKKIIII